MAGRFCKARCGNRVSRAKAHFDPAFCSPSCKDRDASRRRYKTRGREPSPVCLHCGDPIAPPRRFFCCRQHEAAARMRVLRAEAAAPSCAVTCDFCKDCGDPFVRRWTVLAKRCLRCASSKNHPGAAPSRAA